MLATGKFTLSCIIILARQHIMLRINENKCKIIYLARVSCVVAFYPSQLAHLPLSTAPAFLFVPQLSQTDTLQFGARCVFFGTRDFWISRSSSWSTGAAKRDFSCSFISLKSSFTASLSTCETYHSTALSYSASKSELFWPSISNKSKDRNDQSTPPLA